MNALKDLWRSSPAACPALVIGMLVVLRSSDAVAVMRASFAGAAAPTLFADLAGLGWPGRE